MFFIIVLSTDVHTPDDGQSGFVVGRGKNAAFDGLIFDDPTRIDNLQVTRRIEKGPKILYRYDVKFQYQGKDTSVRLLGVPVRNVYLPKGANGSKSKVKLKGEYDKINGAVYDNLQMNTVLGKEKLTFQPASEMRIPLSEEVEDYAFTVVTDPATVVSYTGEPWPTSASS